MIFFFNFLVDICGNKNIYYTESGLQKNLDFVVTRKFVFVFCVAFEHEINGIEFAGAIAAPMDSYAVPVSCAVAAVLIALVLCLICHRKLKRRVEEVHIDDLQQRVDEERRCYHHHHHHHHHSLLDHPQSHSHAHTHNYNQYQLEQPSPPSESERDDEHVCHDDQSSPDSVWLWSPLRTTLAPKFPRLPPLYANQDFFQRSTTSNKSGKFAI